MKSIRFFGIRDCKKVHPTGDPKFSVLQAFPAGFTAEEADPFLMLDHFGPTPSPGMARNVDDFPIAWHPHRGMDILTYMLQGVGRHGDSLGNREIFSTPGCQWISVGSGIEHAESGGTPAGEPILGFQIWVNVPSARKMDDPRYGTHGKEEMPLLSLSGGKVSARLVAGSLGGHAGPFKTVQSVQLVDYIVAPGSNVTHTVELDHDNILVYCYDGAGRIGPQETKRGQVVRFVEAEHGAAAGGGGEAGRTFTLEAGQSELRVLVFAGKRLNQPIAWHGPFVMTTQAEIRQTLEEYSAGTFLKKRAPWNFKKASAFPADKRPQM